MATLLVFHGFNSAGGTDKAAFLRNHLTGVEVLSPTYSHDPDRAVADLQNRIEEHTSRYRSVALLGTSLGAYYARYLGRRHGLPTILINPSLDPISTLRPAVGRNRNFKTGECYWFSESHLAALGRYSCDERHADPPTLVLLDMADELLNPADTARRFQNRSNVRVVCFEGGNHRFAHIGEALPYIAEHIGVASHQ
jgi:predicted esterase YcpF (UPF0227 family)